MTAGAVPPTERRRFAAPPPLSLYVHVPWCVRKCPYCDFNSHPSRGAIDAAGYVAALLRDLDEDLPLVQGRIIQSIFLGGGTPSLLPGEAVDELLAGVRARHACRHDMEVTLEANPGASDAGRFAEYRAAGVNRLSIGVQSLDDHALQRIGRIHDAAEAEAAVEAARRAGFDNLNLDLMFGLPGQSPAQARRDLRQAIALQPSHLSYYQLTLEPNTAFHRSPPSLPEDDALWSMQEQSRKLLAHAGYVQYEVSAYAQPSRECRHNRNYWEFGDYLGIGAGAHAKLTDATAGEIWRLRKHNHPRSYLESAGPGGFAAGREALAAAPTVVEFMLNALRLKRGVPQARFTERTGLTLDCITATWNQATERGLMTRNDRLCATALGWRYLNDLLELFVP